MRGMDRRGWGRRAAGLGVVLAVAGLVGLVGPLQGCATPGPATFSFSERQILAALAERFPASRRVLEVFEVRLAAPRLQLLPAEDRLMLGFDVAVQQRLLAGQPLNGKLMFSSGLRYDAADATVRLVRVRREHLALEGLPGVLATSVNRWGGWLAEELLEGAVVHRVDAATLERAARLGLRPGALKVTEGGVTVTMEPIRPPGA